jgi:hypothetical protein
VSTFIERPANADHDVLVVQIGPEQNAYYKVFIAKCFHIVLVVVVIVIVVVVGGGGGGG